MSLLVKIIRLGGRKHHGDECLSDALLGKGNNAVIGDDAHNAILGEENYIGDRGERRAYVTSPMEVLPPTQT